jgi:hypothetical protein
MKFAETKKHLTPTILSELILLPNEQTIAIASAVIPLRSIIIIAIALQLLHIKETLEKAVVHAKRAASYPHKKKTALPPSMSMELRLVSLCDRRTETEL